MTNFMYVMYFMYVVLNRNAKNDKKVRIPRIPLQILDYINYLAKKTPDLNPNFFLKRMLQRNETTYITYMKYINPVSHCGYGMYIACTLCTLGLR